MGAHRATHVPTSSQPNVVIVCMHVVWLKCADQVVMHGACWSGVLDQLDCVTGSQEQGHRCIHGNHLVCVWRYLVRSTGNCGCSFVLCVAVLY